MKLDPEVKFLRESNRSLKKVISKQRSEIASLDGRKKNVTINLYNMFLKYMVSHLTPSEKEVLSLRFGFKDGIQRTLVDVGKEFDVTGERIRQLEHLAICKIEKRFY